MGKQVMQIESEKNIQGITRRYRHNVRLEEEKKGHIDPERTKNNIELISLPKGVRSAAEFFNKRISELDYYKNHDLRKNGVICQEILLAYGMDGLPEDFSVARWAQQSEQYLKDTYGKENIISAVVHMDEGAPHIHALIMPIVDGRLSARKINGDRDGMRALHTRYYEDYMKHCGLEPEDVGRGSVIKGNVTQFYKALDKTFEETLPERDAKETDREYYERVNKLYQEQTLAKFALTHNLDMLKRENNKLKKHMRYRENELKKEYDRKLSEIEKKYSKEKEDILEKIGGDVERAAEAVHFKTFYDDMMEYALDNYPDKANEINDGLRDLEEVFLQDLEREER